MNETADRLPILAFLTAFCGLLAVALCLASISQSFDAASEPSVAAGSGRHQASPQQPGSSEPQSGSKAAPRARP